MNQSARKASVLAFVAVSAVAVITSVEKQATLNVQPRNWAGLVTYPAALPSLRVDNTGGHTSLYPYWIPLADGRDSFPDGAAARYSWGIDYLGRLGVGSGLNALWLHYASAPPFVSPVVWVSPALYPGDPYYDAQDINVSPRQPAHPGLPRYCTRADVDRIRNEVLWHEGALVGPRRSHHATFVSYFATHDPAEIAERVSTALPADANDSVFHDYRRKAEGAAGYDQVLFNDSVIVHARSNLMTPFCKLRMP